MSTSAVQVVERPILFSGAMVKAILNGRKTQTRRVMKPQPEPRGINLSGLASDANMRLHAPSYCPYGKPGDRIWVRETWIPVAFGSYEPICGKAHRDACQIEYAAAAHSGYHTAWDHYAGKWRPSIHMPRWASRLTLEIVKVRVERLQEISEEDAIAEGVERNCPSWNDPEKIKQCPACASEGVCQAKDEFIHEGLGECDFPVTAKEAYQYLWDSINSKRGHGWDKNPWVWVIEFQRVRS